MLSMDIVLCRSQPGLHQHPCAGSISVADISPDGLGGLPWRTSSKSRALNLYPNRHVYIHICITHIYIDITAYPHIPIGNCKTGNKNHHHNKTIISTHMYTRVNTSIYIYVYVSAIVDKSSSPSGNSNNKNSNNDNHNKCCRHYH